MSSSRRIDALAFELDLRAGVFPEKDFVAGFNVGHQQVAGLCHFAAANSHDFGFLRLSLAV